MSFVANFVTVYCIIVSVFLLLCYFFCHPCITLILITGCSYFTVKQSVQLDLVLLQ